MLVATLISNPASPALDDAVIDIARALLPQPGKPDWLAKGVAADVPFAGDQVAGNSADSSALAESLRAALAGRPVDVAVQAAAGRRKKLLLADMDSTMIGQECIDELADFAGLKAHVSAITERAMRGDIAFEPALRERVTLLKGLPVTIVDEVLKSRIRLTPGGRELVATMRAHGGYACLVSGGFTLFTKAVAAQIGFDENRANTLLTNDGTLAGEVAEPVLGRDAKKATLLDLRARLKLKPDETLAVGDGANDLDMLREAGLGVAYHAKPAVAAAAAARIDYGDLTALLYVQGYRRDEFVMPRE
jgi:phosphoserine phosphatase